MKLFLLNILILLFSLNIYAQEKREYELECPKSSDKIQLRSVGSRLLKSLENLDK